MKTNCDLECALVNDCAPGGIECDWCGMNFCANELGECQGMCVCDECKAELESEASDGETAE